MVVDVELVTALNMAPTGTLVVELEDMAVAVDMDMEMDGTEEPDMLQLDDMVVEAVEMLGTRVTVQFEIEDMEVGTMVIGITGIGRCSTIISK